MLFKLVYQLLLQMIKNAQPFCLYVDVISVCIVFMNYGNKICLNYLQCQIKVKFDNVWCFRVNDLHVHGSQQWHGAAHRNDPHNQQPPSSSSEFWAYSVFRCIWTLFKIHFNQNDAIKRSSYQVNSEDLQLLKSNTRVTRFDITRRVMSQHYAKSVLEHKNAT